MSIKYEINVSYLGKHECTITVDKNGPDDTSVEHARSVMRALDNAWNFAAVADDSGAMPYQFSLVSIETSSVTRRLA